MSPTTIARRQHRAEQAGIAGSSAVGASEDAARARASRLNAWAATMAHTSPAVSLSLATLLARTGI